MFHVNWIDLVLVNTIILVVLLIIVLYFVVACALKAYKRKHILRSMISTRGGGGSGSGGDDIGSTSCSLLTCGALDPVSDPTYNMRLIAQNSLLLEEHLVDKRKYCKDCIAKHMLLNQAYVVEALMLAGNKVSEYPMMLELDDFFEAIFKSWLDTENAHTGKTDSDEDAKIQNRLDVATLLRVKRKEIIAIYILSGDVVSS